MTELKRDDNNSTIWKLNAVNYRKQITKYTLGNGIVVNKTFYNYGFPSVITAGSIQNCTFQFNNQTGNINNRKNNILGLNETFIYDNLNRLTNINYPNNIVPTPVQQEIIYNANGNIESKTGIGDYDYTGIQPHAVKQVSNIAQMIPEAFQEITYNSFNKVSKITEDFSTIDFVYGIDNEQCKSIYKENETTKYTKYFSTNYEKIIDLKKQWKKDKLAIPNFKYNSIYERDKDIFKIGILDSNGYKDDAKTNLTLQFVKNYAFHIDTINNPRIIDFDEITEFCKSKK